MSVLRPFKATDMFKFNNINLDIWTETYGIGFYLSYLSRWPDLCCVQESPNGQMMGYGMFPPSTHSSSHVSQINVLDLSQTHHPRKNHQQHKKPQVLGKAEGAGIEWHGHVTAITVAPEYRRLGLARKMMNLLELVSDELYKGFFVDLYVRCANKVAVEMYEGMGYSVYRRVREYYGSLGNGRGGRDDEDAFDMRKPLSRDPNRISVRPNGRDVIVSAQDVS
ncbi:N-acetyltransferase [Agaricus bisporus var. bisporus H97]|uniref:N-acetyltransferase n=1 Tax=Agaricus bisporus var. bisporus (strain H97 / ATCC MYA-4626 / FGSC 10389) TaxID=936046 RepID=UPI00029F73CB|nr:N-acetyltransferase [Agaricus bisporus var. bisporus H97]EKV49747.1 N-acetyltransferase [Agaricus bisporus var. bisporus H97]